jgi:hypothetical protein
MFTEMLTEMSKMFTEMSKMFTEIPIYLESSYKCFEEALYNISKYADIYNYRYNHKLNYCPVSVCVLS